MHISRRLPDILRCTHTWMSRACYDKWHPLSSRASSPHIHRHLRIRNLTPSLPSSKTAFSQPCKGNCITRNITSHGMKNLAFHSLLRWKIILPVLAASLIHFSLKSWENVLFELGSERVESYEPDKRCPNRSAPGIDIQPATHPRTQALFLTPTG